VVREVGVKMTKKRMVLVSVCPEFRNILKVESALRGKSVVDFTRDIAGQDMFVSEYMERLQEEKRRAKKHGNGFIFKI
jgi:hypothetical protein